jgi:hypothetical protein
MASPVHPHPSSEAEVFARRLFEHLGYEVKTEAVIAGLRVDLVVERDGSKSPVEVKWWGKHGVPLSGLREVAARLHSITQIAPEFSNPILVVIQDVSPQARAWADETFAVKIWDNSFLRKKTKRYDDLSRQLSELSGDRHDNLSADANVEATNRLIQRLRKHQVSDGLTWKEYEQLCQEVITFLFDPFLYGFQAQTETTDGANRYDFICRIKPGDSFWDALRTDFRTRSVLFECKNHDKPITADQIYSTERYLFSGALRTVCMLISRKGADDGCRRAAQGALREAGKLILLLSNTDLIKMLELKAEADGPTSYLDEQIWKFITTLPR